MNYIVYEHVFPNSKKYVGITCQKKNRRWRFGKGYSFNIRMTNAIKKYGWENIAHNVLYSNLTQEEAEEIERRLIKEQDLTDPDKGYNYSIGGIHPRHTEATKKKIGERSLGRKHSEEFKKWISERNSGANNYMYGKHHSEETKRKISETKKAHPTPSPNKGKYGKENPSSKRVACINPQTRKITYIYDSISEAAIKTSRSYSCIEAALHKRQKTCAGYEWIYI